MDVEAKPALASGDIEIEAPIAQVQVPRWVEDIVDCAEHLPIGMRADAKAADIPIGREPEAVAEFAVIARADQRIGPAGAAGRGGPSEQAGIELHSGGEPPSAKAEAGIGELHRVFEHSPEGDPGARIRVQLSVAALVKHVAGCDLRAHRQVNGVSKEAEITVASLERPHKRGPVEMGQKIDAADVRVYFGSKSQRR